MRKLAAFSVALAFVCGAQTASAADLLYKDTYVAPPAPIWAGYYFGGHVGGLWDDDGDSKFFKKRNCCRGYDWREFKDAKFSDDDDVSFLGGVHIGYNTQEGANVFGIEADISFGDNIDYLASLRARLGYAIDNLLIYATAGVGFVGFDDKTVEVGVPWGDGTETFDFSGDNKVGLVVGGGAEYKLASNLSLGVEGLYYFFGDSEDTGYDEWRCYEKKLVHEDDNDLFVVRGRLTYHLQEDTYTPLK